MWIATRRRFEESARRPLPRVDGPTGVPDDVRADVVRSLQIFQRGESGEGRIATEIDRCASPAIDDDYRAALKLFVAEEGRHARILGDLIRALGADVIDETWTARLFVLGRRLMGVRLKLLVLLAAEVVGVGFYGLIAARLDDGSVRRALREICADEERHLEFHRAFFGRACAGFPSRAAFVVAWAVVGAAACAVVLVDHRRTLAALRVSAATAVRVLAALLRGAGRLEASSRDDAPPRTPADVLARP